jgi:CRISPR-associated protein Cst2
MSHTILGFVLIDAPHSALNNAGDTGARTENIVAVKIIRRGGRVYPYVSAQAWRFWWRTTLQARSGWTLSPVIRQAKVAFTSANPFTYPDDDVFGYMRAQREQDGGTLTRISPLKCSPLVSVTDQFPVDDFGVMARQRDGDPVPFEHQFYAVTLKGIFSLDLSGVGMFAELPKTGYKNLDARYVARPEMQQAIHAAGAVRNGNDSLAAATGIATAARLGHAGRITLSWRWREANAAPDRCNPQIDHSHHHRWWQSPLHEYYA